MPDDTIRVQLEVDDDGTGDGGTQQEFKTDLTWRKCVSHLFTVSQESLSFSEELSDFCV